MRSSLSIIATVTAILSIMMATPTSGLIMMNLLSYKLASMKTMSLALRHLKQQQIKRRQVTSVKLRMQSESTNFLSSLSMPFKKWIPGDSLNFLSTLTEDSDKVEEKATATIDKKKENVKEKKQLNVDAFMKNIGIMHQELEKEIGQSIAQTGGKNNKRKKLDKRAKNKATASTTVAGTIRLPKGVRKHIRTLKSQGQIEKAQLYYTLEMTKAQQKARAKMMLL